SRSAGAVTAMLEELLERHPGNTYLVGVLCRNVMAEGRPEDAKVIIERHLELMPDSPDLQRIAGDVLLRNGEPGAAAEAYQKYIEAGPLDPDIRDIHSFVVVHKYRKLLLSKGSVTPHPEGQLP
nr:tetratricopeptide repeat protein [bacterium]